MAPTATVAKTTRKANLLFIKPPFNSGIVSSVNGIEIVSKVTEFTRTAISHEVSRNQRGVRQRHGLLRIDVGNLFPLAATVIQLRCIPVTQLVFVDLLRYAS